MRFSVTLGEYCCKNFLRSLENCSKLISDGKQFSIRAIGAKVEVKTPVIKNIDREYIRSISTRAMEDVDKNNYDSATS